MHAFFFFQAEDGIRDLTVTGVQTCALPISLAKAKDWVRYSDKATRELDVMPQWAGSCWYYLRFCDPESDKRFVGEEAERYWAAGKHPGTVDLYVGGTEHAVLHLLYSRFWHQVLFDLRYGS